MKELQVGHSIQPHQCAAQAEMVGKGCIETPGEGLNGRACIGKSLRRALLRIQQRKPAGEGINPGQQQRNPDDYRQNKSPYSLSQLQNRK